MPESTQDMSKVPLNRLYSFLGRERVTLVAKKFATRAVVRTRKEDPTRSYILKGIESLTLAEAEIRFDDRVIPFYGASRHAGIAYLLALYLEQTDSILVFEACIESALETYDPKDYEAGKRELSDLVVQTMEVSSG